VTEPLRRRRDAANRCQPLDSGYRDPLDALTEQGRAFKGAWITTEDARGVFILKGRGSAQVLRHEGMRPMWSGSRRGFLLDLYRLPDAVAALEWAGYVVRVRGEAG
jgi:hypothetical protein